ncbi:MAG: M23 family metallopeptidase [Flavisolibacter sp.]|nr:M23 family metallopeptidase [Flavisolibacter sp.]
MINKTEKVLNKAGTLLLLVLSLSINAQEAQYPNGYFRNPLNIPMQLVANFGEIRTNHWHMGLDIRTQQRENLPVYAAADGYVAKIKIEPGGFGRAIYINHPNGYTTLYAHLNDFFPALEQWVKEQQYQLQSWQVELAIPPALFPVNKGDFIAYSGNTGGSAGPHVHFEIRDIKTENCFNPLLFSFSIPDAVPPLITRLALYDRNRSVYAQSPQLITLRRAGNVYSLAKAGILKVGTDKISFAIGAVDMLSGSPNPKGIYSAQILMDDVMQSTFVLDNISYDETRYLNAQIDYRYKFNGGAYLQHLSRMPGDKSTIYRSTATDGVLYLTDTIIHTVRIEVKDAAQNQSILSFDVQFDSALRKPVPEAAVQKFYPNNVNVFETDLFEAFTSEYTLYDTATVSYTLSDVLPSGAVSPLYQFMSASIPVHDSVTVRIKPSVVLNIGDRNRVVIKNVSGNNTTVKKAKWQNGWLGASFRQFGTYQAFIDSVPPVFNAPGIGDTIDLRKIPRLVFTPRDNFNTIKSFRAEIDGQWLRFTNDKSRTWIYKFDEHFPPGVHELKVMVEDEAGNITTKTWWCRR